MSEEDSISNQLNKYYKLKANYESSISDKKKKIIHNNKLSMKEKREEFKKYKPKCINCKRIGGTNFTSNIEKGERLIRAICNISSNPCNLDIKINLGSFYLIRELLDEIQDSINKVKNEIIKNKNKQLFNFIDDNTVVSVFDKLKKDLNEKLMLLEEYTIFFTEELDNKEEKEDYKKKFENAQIYIAEIKECIKKFNETDQNSFIQDAINIYINKLTETNEILSSIKYKTKFVSYDNNDNTYHLIQQQYSIESSLLELVPPKVESFVYGTIKYNKTIQIDETELTTNPYTIKDGIINWKNNSYEKIYNDFSKELKEVLKNDPEWMKLFLTSCYNNRKKGKPCEFINPVNLIIPPKKIKANGIVQFDLGNKDYNKFFNQLTSSYQDTLLTLFSVKKGEKDYSMFLDTLANLMSDHLHYDRFINKYARI